MTRATVALSLLLAVSSASAGPPRVQLGKVEAVPVAESALEPVLRSAFEEELKKADFEGAKLAKRYILSAALVKLESAVEQKVATTRCVISVTLRTQDHVLVAIIQGSAKAEGPVARPTEARKAALLGAVRSAVTKVPKALFATERRK